MELDELKIENIKLSKVEGDLYSSDRVYADFTVNGYRTSAQIRPHDYRYMTFGFNEPELDRKYEAGEFDWEPLNKFLRKNNENIRETLATLISQDSEMCRFIRDVDAALPTAEEAEKQGLNVLKFELAKRRWDDSLIVSEHEGKEYYYTYFQIGRKNYEYRPKTYQECVSRDGDIIASTAEESPFGIDTLAFSANLRSGEIEYIHSQLRRLVAQELSGRSEIAPSN